MFLQNFCILEILLIFNTALFPLPVTVDIISNRVNKIFAISSGSCIEMKLFSSISPLQPNTVAIYSRSRNVGTLLFATNSEILKESKSSYGIGIRPVFVSVGVSSVIRPISIKIDSVSILFLIVEL